MDILHYYHNRAQARTDTLSDFDNVVEKVSRAQLAAGIVGMLRSSSTANFPQTMGWLFEASGAELRAKLLAVLQLPFRGTSVETSDSDTGSGHSDAGDGRSGTIVEIARCAEARDPSVVIRIGILLAQNPKPLRALGDAWVAVLLSHIPDGEELEESGRHS